MSEVTAGSGIYVEGYCVAWKILQRLLKYMPSELPQFECRLFGYPTAIINSGVYLVTQK